MLIKLDGGPNIIIMVVSLFFGAFGIIYVVKNVSTYSKPQHPFCKGSNNEVLSIHFLFKKYVVKNLCSQNI